MRKLERTKWFNSINNIIYIKVINLIINQYNQLWISLA